MLKALDFSALWTATREKSFDVCVSALQEMLIVLDALQQSQGEWRIMRTEPNKLGRLLALDQNEMRALLSGELDPTTISKNLALFGHGFNIEYVGPIPLAINGRVCVTDDDIRFKNYVALSFRHGAEVPDYQLTDDQVEEIFKVIVKTWEPQVALSLFFEASKVNPFKSATFPRVSWWHYFGEPEVVKMLGDLGEEFAGGVVIKTAERFTDLTPSRVAEFAHELHNRGLSDILYREL